MHPAKSCCATQRVDLHVADIEPQKIRSLKPEGAKTVHGNLRPTSLLPASLGDRNAVDILGGVDRQHRHRRVPAHGPHIAHAETVELVQRSGPT
jgi:hypothetical protein